MKRSLRLALIVGGVVVVLTLSTMVGAQDEIDGRDVYLAKCAACHQGTGLGVAGSFPPLAGNDNVGDTAYVKTVIIEGRTGPLEVLGQPYDGEMPAFPDLSVPEIDALIGGPRERSCVRPVQKQGHPVQNLLGDLLPQVLVARLVEVAVLGPLVFG